MEEADQEMEEVGEIYHGFQVTTVESVAYRQAEGEESWDGETQEDE